MANKNRYNYAVKWAILDESIMLSAADDGNSGGKVASLQKPKVGTKMMDFEDTSPMWIKKGGIKAKDLRKLNEWSSLNNSSFPSLKKFPITHRDLSNRLDHNLEFATNLKNISTSNLKGNLHRDLSTRFSPECSGNLHLWDYSILKRKDEAHTFSSNNQKFYKRNTSLEDVNQISNSTDHLTKLDSEQLLSLK
jgi:hypothetical protein